MVCDVVAPEIPLVLHLLVADLTRHLPAHCVHVQDMLKRKNFLKKHLEYAPHTQEVFPFLPAPSSVYLAFFYFFEISSLFTSIHFHPLLLVDPLPL